MNYPIIKDNNGWTISVKQNFKSEIVITNEKGKEYYIEVPKEDMKDLLSQHPDYASHFSLSSDTEVPKKVESEYKFLVSNQTWKEEDGTGKGEYYQQLYVAKDSNFWQARIRIHDGEHAKFTIKGPRVGITNPEFEYSIPVDMAKEIWNESPGARLEKIRYKVQKGEDLWEIDEFVSASLKGLYLTELEVSDVNKQINKPLWAGVEVTHEKSFRNDSLADYNFRMKHLLSENDELFFAINKAGIMVSDKDLLDVPNIARMSSMLYSVISTGMSITDNNIIELLDSVGLQEHKDNLSAKIVNEMVETLVSRNPVLQAQFLSKTVTNHKKANNKQKL